MTEKEIRKSFNYVVRQIVRTTGCTWGEAEKRYLRLHDSKLLEGLTPDDKVFIVVSEAFALTPSNEDVKIGPHVISKAPTKNPK